jgi:DNA mismatch repair ATPase MutS
MPLRQAEDINARYNFSHEHLAHLEDTLLRLDAVEDLMNNPAFEEEFTALAKGLPDLERIVSRIHAKNCKIKVFLHALSVSLQGVRSSA